MSYRLRELIRLGVDPRLLHDQGLLHGGKGKAPPAPDYAGAATAQGQASKESTTQQTWANRPEQNTPWGQVTWGTEATTDPATGQPVTKWSQNETLNPQIQGALESQIALQGGRSDLGQSFMGRVEQDYSQPFDWSGLPPTATAPTADAAERQRIEGAMFDRMRPEHQFQEEAARTRLANQGLTQGSEAYDRELQRVGDQQSRERFNALEMGGQEQQRLFGMGMQSSDYQNKLRQQAITEQAQRRGMSLNEMNALLTGQQVGAPQMPSFTSSQGSQTPNYLGAAGMQGQYGLNAQEMANQQNAGLWGGIGQLAGTGAMLYGMGAFSDERLKTNIVKVGDHPVGVGIYEYDIFGHRERGVMAQELLFVRPELVREGPDGWLMVNYGGL